MDSRMGRRYPVGPGPTPRRGLRAANAHAETPTGLMGIVPGGRIVAMNERSARPARKP
jgi:hypothetical protein